MYANQVTTNVLHYDILYLGKKQFYRISKLKDKVYEGISILT